MKKTLDLMMALSVLALGSVALAQSPLPTTDPSKLGADVTVFAATLMFIVQFIKRQFERQGRALRWYVTLGLTLALGESIAALLFYSGYGAKFGNAAPPMAWILFGAVAAAIAAGLKDLLVGLAERNRSTTIVNASPAPMTPATQVLPPGEIPPTDIQVSDPALLPGFQPESESERQTRLTGVWYVDDDAPLAQ